MATSRRLCRNLYDSLAFGCRGVVGRFETQEDVVSHVKVQYHDNNPGDSVGDEEQSAS